MTHAHGARRKSSHAIKNVHGCQRSKVRAPVSLPWVHEANESRVADENDAHEAQQVANEQEASEAAQRVADEFEARERHSAAVDQARQVQRDRYRETGTGKHKKQQRKLREQGKFKVQREQHLASRPRQMDTSFLKSTSGWRSRP